MWKFLKASFIVVNCVTHPHFININTGLPLVIRPFVAMLFIVGFLLEGIRQYLLSVWQILNSNGVKTR